MTAGWRWAGARSKGTSHEKTGLPCQDYGCAKEVDGPVGPVLIAVISDGAGSALRADVGSKIASITMLRLAGGLYSVFVDYIDKHLEALTDRMAYLGSVQQGLETHDEANRARIDVVTKGIGGLVDADMGEASARVRALETQQQLAVQKLSIANAQSDIILPLFQ